MNYNVVIDKQKQYVTAIIDGPITRKTIFEINHVMVEQSKDFNISAFLFDVRNSINEETVFGNYQIAYEDAEKVSFIRNAKYAVLHSPDDNSHHFIEIVANNVGYNLKLFTDENAAIHWLCE